MEWLNSPGPYTQYTHNPDSKIVEIIEKFGFAFDDNYWYWIPKIHRKRGLNSHIVKRAPLWTYPRKSVPVEKSRRHKATNQSTQQKLQDCVYR